MRPLPKVVIFEAQHREVAPYVKRLLFRGYRVLLVTSAVTEELKALSQDIRVQVRLNPPQGGIPVMTYWADRVHH